MVNEFNGFKKGIIGKDLPSDTTLMNMRKSELVKLLHTAQHNYDTLMWFYNNAVNANMKWLKENSWIPCSERLPEVETEVLIHARRKYTGGHFLDIITTAMYEDGTVRENDSSWGWEDIDGEWDEEEECWIVPNGWWENKHYNPDGVLNNEVDDEVIEWMPLPTYQKGE